MPVVVRWSRRRKARTTDSCYIVEKSVKAATACLSLVLLFLSTANAFAQDPPDNPFADFETRVLPNGLKIWYKRMPGQPNVALSVTVQVGSDRDPLGKEQLAHFLEHMQFSDHLGLSTQEIKKQIEDRGGVWNGYTAADRTFYFVHIKKEHALFALDWLYRIASPHEMKPEVVERELHPVEVEVGAKPREMMEWLNALYFNPPYLRSPGLWKREFNMETTERRDFYLYRSLRSITSADLKQFYDSYYSPSRMTVSIIGDVDRDQLFDLAGRTFATLRQVQEPSPQPATTDAGRARSTFSWGFNSDIYYNRRVRFGAMTASDDVMLTFIGRFLNKRLNDRLRFGERKAVYGMSAGSAKRGPAAYFSIAGWIRPSEFKFATGVIDEEIEALRKGSLTDATFEAERSVLVQQLRVSYSTPENLESWVGYDFSNRDRHRDFPDLLSAFQTIRKSDVAEFASQHFVPEREFNETTYPFPLSQAMMGLLGVGLLLGTVKLMRAILTRPVDMKRIRYVAHLRVPGVLLVAGGAVLVSALAIGLRLLVYAYELSSNKFLDSRDSFVLQWLAVALLVATIVAVIVLALSVVPSKVLLFDDRLLIKYYAYRSVSIPLDEIEDLSFQRFGGVWLNRRFWKCVPFKCGLVSPGIYLRRRGGWSYFFDVRDRKELFALLTPVA